MLLDIKSLLITSGLEVMVNALVLMLAWRSEKELRTVIGFWGISQALLGLGMFLVALQGSVPVFWGLVFSNTCMALGFVAEQEGLACYIGKRGYLRPVMLGTLFCFAMGMCFFSYVYASAAYRVVTFSLGTVIFTMVFVITLVKSEANREAPVRLLVATYIYQTIIMAVRTVVAFLQGDYAYSFLNFGGIHVILLLALFTCNTSQAVCYFWLIVHRLSRENQKQAAEITRTLSMKQETLEWLVDKRTRDLQASESKVRALIDAVPDMLLVSSGEGRIEEAYVNHNFSTLFSPETLQGKLIQEVLPQGIADEIVQRTQQAMASNQNAQYEFALLHGTDKLQLRTRIMRLNDRQVFHIVTDITEQKRLETEMLGALSQLQEAQKLSTAGVMAASIVHDLGQPLNSIKVSTEGLLYISGMGTKLNMDKIMGELQRISRQVERIEGVITNVRHIVRQDLQLRRGIVLDAALFHAIEAFQSVPGNAAVAIQYQCQVPQAIVCAADSEIEQILFNLLKNAQEAVTVSPKPDKFIFVTAAENGEWLEIAVSDNGSGIKEAILPNVFDPFFTTKKKYGSDNLGFGLAIVKSLTESLKGSVTAHNNEIGGATFVIRLLNENQRRISDEHNSH